MSEFTEPTTNDKTTRNTIIFIADIILFFILLNTLPFDAPATKGLALLVFIGILWLTEAIHITVTALLVPILAVVLGLIKSKEALSGFADPIVFLFFGGFALATALHIQKLDLLIANKIMTLARGKFSVAIFYLFGVTTLLSMWISNTATTAMMLPLAMGILSKMDSNPSNSSTFAFVLLGVAYSANIGGMGSLVGSPPNGIVAQQLGLTFADWFKYGLPIVFILIPLMVGTLYIVIKPKLNQVFDHNFEKIPLNRDRIITLGIFALTAIFWVFSENVNITISGLFGIEGKIASFDSIIALAAAVMICISRVASWQQIQDNTEWGILMLFGGGITLSAVLGQSGASKVMADGIIILIEGGHYYIMGLIVATFIVFLTELSSNTASSALLVPIFISIAKALGIPPIGLALIIGLGASCAFMLPVATPPNAIVFGTGKIKQSEMLKAGFWLNIISIFVLATFAYQFWL